MTTPDPSRLIAARRAQAEQTKDYTLKMIAAMIRRREPITFAGVAAQAGVSRQYLYRTPDLADRIRTTRGVIEATALTDQGGGQPVVAALRDHIRRLESQHADSVAALRTENRQLRRQLKTALGLVIADDRPARARVIVAGEEMAEVPL